MLIYGSQDEKAKNKIKDTELLNLFTKAQGLDDKERDTIKSMLKAFIFQKDMQKQLAQ